jgi:ribonuclease BN (tRNA processing enzyme)
MQLDVIGAGPAYSDRPGAVGACYLVTAERTAIVLDLGHGAFSGLASRVDPATLDAVLVSHLHADHFVDLVPLRHYLRYECPPGSRVRVIAPPGLADRIDGLAGEQGFAAASLDVEDLAPGTVRIGPLTIEAALVTHTTSSFGFRVAGFDGTGLVYSGDLAVADDLGPITRPGDVLLIEAAFGPGPVEQGAMHLDGPAVGRFAVAARVGRVLVTHVLMRRDVERTLAAIRSQYRGPVDLVVPGSHADIGGPLGATASA